MRRFQFAIALSFVLLTISLAGAQAVLDVFKENDDVGLTWVPINGCRAEYSLAMPPSYITIVDNAPPPVYHQNVLTDGNNYFYNVDCGLEEGPIYREFMAFVAPLPFAYNVNRTKKAAVVFLQQ